MAKTKKLFNEFPRVGREEWEAKIEADLKGAPYKKLITKTIEGIDLKPYYHKEDLSKLDYLNTLPGEFPYTRSDKIQLNEWEIRQDIPVSEIHVANLKALSALNKGASSIAFIFPDGFIFEKNSISDLLRDIFFECIHISFHSRSKAKVILEQFISLADEKKIDKSKIRGSINSDPLQELILEGKNSKALPSAFDDLAERIQITKKTFPVFKQIEINADIFHNAGASAVQELAMALSMLAENFDQLTDRGLNIDDIAPSVVLNFSAGPSYFMEIAKFRAARMLFAQMVRSYNPESEKSEKVFIHATTSEWNQTVYDPYVNMLRGTTEGMSAVLGNVDSLSIKAFDTAYRPSTDFSERIARNTQIILKEEAHLNKIVDPSAGSYYIESLTDSIADLSWKLFLQIEENGGFIEGMKKGFIQNIIEETAQKRDMNIAGRREILLGTNQYPNQDERLDDEIKKAVSTGKIIEGDIKAIKKYRGARAFEELRIQTEKAEKRPVVFLLTYGNLGWSKARAGFASGFFACAGYKIIDNNGFKTIQEGMQEAKKRNADIVVLCSSDDEYPVIAPEAMTLMEKGNILVIAGYPADSVDMLKDKGIENFIHVKSNLLEDLKKFNAQLGIN